MKPPARLAVASCLCGPLALLVGGCSAYRAPRFDIVAVEERERTDEAVVLNFVLTAHNPNDRDVPLEQARYRLRLDGVEVFDGHRSAEAVIQGYGDQTIELPAVVPAERFDLSRFDGGADLTYELSGAVEYITPGELAEVLFDTGVRRPKAPIGITGEIALVRTLLGHIAAASEGRGSGEGARDQGPQGSGAEGLDGAAGCAHDSTSSMCVPPRRSSSARDSRGSNFGSVDSSAMMNRSSPTRRNRSFFMSGW